MSGLLPLVDDFRSSQKTYYKRRCDSLDFVTYSWGVNLALGESSKCYVNGKADYRLIAGLAAFQDGISRLLIGAKDYRVALMCAEQDPLTCHRTILVCRALKPHQIHIEHILRDGAMESHETAERRLMFEEGENPGQAEIFAPVSANTDVALNRAYDRRGSRSV